MSDVRVRPEADPPEPAPAQAPPRRPSSAPDAGGPTGRRWPVVLAVALAVVLVAEAAVRLLDDRLAAPLEWPSIEVQQKVAQIDALDELGGVDVVVVGSSLANGGIVPEVLMEELGDGTTAYNAGLSAGVPLLTEPWTVHVVLPRLRPDVLVVGVSSFDFYDHPSSDEFERAFGESDEGGRVTGDESPLQALDRRLGDISALWAHKAVLRDPENLIDAIRGTTPAPRGEFGPVGPLGRTEYGHRRAPVVPGAAAQGPPVDGWSIGTRNRAALGRTIADARARGIEVVLVDMPVTQAYVDRHPAGDADYERFLEELRRFADARGATLLEHDDRRDPADFVDQVHLDPEAAVELTRLLAGELAELRTGSR